MRSTGVRGLAAVAVVMCLVAATACVPPPPAVKTFTSTAKTLKVVKQSNEPPTFLDNDYYDEPYMFRLAFRVKLGVPNSGRAWLRHSYPNIICNAEDDVAPFATPPGKSLCDIPAGQGQVAFPGVTLPDLFDLDGNTPVELLGTIDVVFEEDQAIDIGPPDLWTAMAAIIQVVLNDIVASGEIPETPEQIINLIGDLLGPALAAVGGVISSAIGGLGDPDDLVGLRVNTWVAAGGSLASILGGLLPPVIDVVNFFLMNDPESGFPDGLPITIGTTNSASNTQKYSDGVMDYRVGYTQGVTGP